MADLFDALAARALDVAPLLQPALRPRFAPTDPNRIGSESVIGQGRSGETDQSGSASQAADPQSRTEPVAGQRPRPAGHAEAGGRLDGPPSSGVFEQAPVRDRADAAEAALVGLPGIAQPTSTGHGAPTPQRGRQLRLPVVSGTVRPRDDSAIPRPMRTTQTAPPSAQTVRLDSSQPGPRSASGIGDPGLLLPVRIGPAAAPLPSGDGRTGDGRAGAGRAGDSRTGDSRTGDRTAPQLARPVEVTVSIGRVEVRTVAARPTPPAASATTQSPTPRMTLQDYLRRSGRP